ncbi:helix-turn-helix transcriptional regulator [Streptomyces sp. LaPpAH-108]|uniref:helix-turn-helix transcriptional regulator n=1 Tax=Streptomyces sp. LaPpAH-108 TaxID=1155714 RepID=UPI00036F3EA4|nr:helix-turn-helix transcriptional regulator [Streptomyces sp. LaPpAH-108]
MDAPSDLGDFLKSRRAALRPEEAGLTPLPTRRRVTGLRREELAMLSGVSVTHYTRLEQGRAAGASDSVLNAIARTLRLTEDETAHLKALAHPVRSATTPPRPEQASASVRQLLASMREIPALALDRRNDVLAWNPLGHALLAAHLPANAPDASATRPNLTRMLFLDPAYRALYRDRPSEAVLAVASLRQQTARHPDDPALTALVGHLTIHSSDFTPLWNRHPVRTCTSGMKRLRHPPAGDMDLAFETLTFPASSGQRLITYTAEAGSDSARALRSLLEETLPSAHPPEDPSSTPRFAIGSNLKHR